MSSCSGISRALVGESIAVHFGRLAALRGVSFTLRAGVVTGLVGPNGSGKTTLINVISGFIPASGSIALHQGDEKVRLDHLSAAKRALLGTGRTFQTPQLFPQLTVLECVAMGAVWVRPHHWSIYLQAIGWPPARREFAIDLARAREALDLLHLSHVADANPRLLPLGQQRIIEVARAIAGDRSFLLLDEPLAGLNREEQQQMLQVIDRLARKIGLGILLVEHNLEAVKAAVDVVWVMNLGEIIASGAPAHVFGDADVQRIYGGA